MCKVIEKATKGYKIKYGKRCKQIYETMAFIRNLQPPLVLIICYIVRCLNGSCETCVISEESSRTIERQV